MPVTKPNLHTSQTLCMEDKIKTNYDLLNYIENDPHNRGSNFKSFVIYGELG